MSPDISKYFWGFNKKTLKETEKVLKDTGDPRFAERMVILLSRCDRPKELFSLISKKDFIESWPRIRNYWRKLHGNSDFKDWWQTIYEGLVGKGKPKDLSPKGKPPASFLKIGRMIKTARINHGLNQNELALRVGMKQPDISAIEQGKKNITLGTLTSLCKVLGIKNVEILD